MRIIYVSKHAEDSEQSAPETRTTIQKIKIELLEGSGNLRGGFRKRGQLSPRRG